MVNQLARLYGANKDKKDLPKWYLDTKRLKASNLVRRLAMLLPKHPAVVDLEVVEELGEPTDLRVTLKGQKVLEVMVLAKPQILVDSANEVAKGSRAHAAPGALFGSVKATGFEWLEAKAFLGSVYR